MNQLKTTESEGIRDVTLRPDRAQNSGSAVLFVEPYLTVPGSGEAITTHYALAAGLRAVLGRCLPVSMLGPPDLERCRFALGLRFWRICTSKGHQLNIKNRRTKLLLRSHFFSKRAVDLWNKLPEDVSAISTDEFKTSLKLTTMERIYCLSKEATKSRCGH